MTPCRVCVVKVGGSLLSSAQLPQRLRAWLATETTTQTDTHFVLVVGGGRMVDAVREIDARDNLDPQAVHWMCVSLMDVTAGLVGAMLPEIAVVTDFGQVAGRLSKPGTTLLRPSEFLRQVEPTATGTKLRADWSVTSDAIAGRLAIVLRAEELVLIKSAAPPVSAGNGPEIDNMAILGYVDEFLPLLAAELLPVRFATLPAVPSGWHSGSRVKPKLSRGGGASSAFGASKDL